MSLIEEALRRVPEPARDAEEAVSPQAGAGQPASATTVHSWPTQPVAASSQPRTSNMTDLLVTITVAVFGLATVLGVGGLFWISRAMQGDQFAVVSTHLGAPRTPSVAAAGQTSARLTQVPHGVETDTAQAQAIEPAQPRPASRQAPAMQSPLTISRGDSRRPKNPFVLSGVVEGLGQPYAVINGEIVSVGERVGDATLVAIAEGSVRLRLPDEREIVLRVSR